MGCKGSCKDCQQSTVITTFRNVKKNMKFFSYILQISFLSETVENSGYKTISETLICNPKMAKSIKNNINT